MNFDWQLHEATVTHARIVHVEDALSDIHQLSFSINENVEG